MKKNYIIIGVVVLVAVIIFVSLKSKEGDSKSEEVTESLQENTVSSESVVEVNSNNMNTEVVVSPITVTGGNYYFKPNIIKAKKGDTISIIFKNSGGMHDFVVDEFSVRTKVVESGAEETITFVVDKKGSFEYYCSVGQHRQMGMKGTLIVE